MPFSKIKQNFPFFCVSALISLIFHYLLKIKILRHLIIFPFYFWFKWKIEASEGSDEKRKTCKTKYRSMYMHERGSHQHPTTREKAKAIQWYSILILFTQAPCKNVLQQQRHALLSHMLWFLTWGSLLHLLLFEFTETIFLLGNYTMSGI